MSDRINLSRQFLKDHGWADAKRQFLAGDASDRTYDRLTRANGESAVLMDSPPGKGDDPAAFVKIAEHLHGAGLSPPRVLAKNLTHGFLLIEDLGDALFARVLEKTPALEPDLYRAAAQVLLHLQSQPVPAGLDNLSAQDWAAAAAFALDWYAHSITGKQPDKSEFIATLAKALGDHADGPRVMILRDYHAENLLLLPDRQGAASVGLLDFQLAQLGQPGYDLVSLLQDARRDVSASLAAEIVTEFAKAKGSDPDAFLRAYAVLGAQRALRILGIFARLCVVGGKPSYLRLLPRVWGHLQQNLAHPALSDFRSLCRAALPEPTEDVIQRIRDKCATPSP
jgi:N-acetylmuramate 1-kinase